MEKRCFQLFIFPGSYRPTYSCDKEGYIKASELVNIQNGKRNVYRSIYDYMEEPGRNNSIVDKIYIDFDPDEEQEIDPIVEAKKLSNYLQKKDILHTLYFSGRGTHVYIYINPIMAYELNNPSIAIKNYVRELSEKLDLHPDQQVIGDLRRISRMPNTINLRTGLYCIPLKKDEIGLNKEKIHDIAKKQRQGRFPIGKNKIELRDYDTEDKRFEHKIDYSDVKLGEDINGVPKCVEASLMRGDANYQERFNIIVALRDLAYSQSDTEAIIEKYLTAIKPSGVTYAEHCIDEEKQVEKLFNRHDLVFPSCQTIQNNGFCVKGCKGQNIYL